MRTKVYSASEILRLEFKGEQNFVTPHVVEIGTVHPRVAYELSTGKVMEHVLWGVTFAGVDTDGTTWRAVAPFSTCFQSRAAAEAHILAVKNFVHPRAPKSLLRPFMLVLVMFAPVFTACRSEQLPQLPLPPEPPSCDFEQRVAQFAIEEVPPLAQQFLVLSRSPDAEREARLCGRLDVVVGQAEERVVALDRCRQRQGRERDPALDEGLAAVRRVRSLCSSTAARRQP